MNKSLKSNVTDTNVWTRLLFMALFGIVYAVSRFVLLAVVIVQCLWLLITGHTNERLLAFGAQMATFVYQILRYLTFNSDTRPFPFSDWPDEQSLIPEEIITEDSNDVADPVTDAVVIEEIIDPVNKPENQSNKPA